MLYLELRAALSGQKLANALREDAPNAATATGVFPRPEARDWRLGRRWALAAGQLLLGSASSNQFLRSHKMPRGCGAAARTPAVSTERRADRGASYVLPPPAASVFWGDAFVTPQQNRGTHYSTPDPRRLLPLARPVLSFPLGLFFLLRRRVLSFVIAYITEVRC